MKRPFMTKIVGCKDLGIPCDHAEVGDKPDDLVERLVRHIVLEHGRRDTAEVRKMIRQSVKEFQRQIGR